MFRGFWGLKIAPGKTYTQTVDAAFRVSNASLGVQVTDESRTSVLLTVDQKSFVLCSLTPGKVEQQLLDISLTEGEEITFETHGKNEIHLTGNFVADDEDDEDGMYDTDEEDEEGEDIDLSNISPEQLQDLVNRGLIDPSDLAIGSDESDDEEYDSDDAEADDRIREITEEEEDELVAEAMSEDEEEGEKPIVEVKIKKQAEKKRKPAADEDAKPAAAAAADAKPSKKAKQAEKAAAVKQEKAGKAKSLPGGVVVETKTEGSGAPAKKGQRVGMYYIGKLTNGKVFDQNTKGKPFWFRLGAGEVIKGWDTGIIGMKKGEERRLTIPGPMAYGSRGAPPDIPPHATLVFDIRLVEFK
ncbi:peptidylprolyl isomerase fpr3 [Coemansia aciculifera]|uniref:Peptidylprolyl isomerase fpr3 n=1 Tax=Coemansia aciculifera TaxID=417176 RepID=A0ACC1M182_9FUNG|nr:peptidylprolyl isomerase fpr3 [Coemansia aciculifera]